MIPVFQEIRHDKFKMSFHFWKYPEGQKDELMFRHFVEKTCTSGLISGAYKKKDGKHAEATGIVPLTVGVIAVKVKWTRYGWMGLIEFNPSKASEMDWKMIRNVIDQCLTLGVSGFVTSGYVNHAELALDIDGVQYGDVCVLDSRVRSTNENFSSKGTTYIGGRDSSRRIVAYDKAKQLLEVEGLAPPSPRLRIEAVLKPSGLHIEQIGQIVNPFASTLVVDRARLQGAKGFRGFYPVNADTSKKADDRQKGVSCPSEESSAKSLSARRST